MLLLIRGFSYRARLSRQPVPHGSVSAGGGWGEHAPLPAEASNAAVTGGGSSLRDTGACYLVVEAKTLDGGRRQPQSRSERGKCVVFVEGVTFSKGKAKENERHSQWWKGTKQLTARL